MEEKRSQHKNFNFSILLFNMKGNQTRVIESSDSDIKKADDKCCSGKYKSQNMLSMSLKVQKVTSIISKFSPTHI